MTQEDKQLLLIDLCGRLAYGVKCNVYERMGVLVGLNDYGAEIDYGNGEDTTCEIKFCKPYLRPMSSMTKEESAELTDIINEWFVEELFELIEEPFLEHALSNINYSINPRLFDWLNKKMFDFRGLIPKGLALSTEEFNPYK